MGNCDCEKALAELEEYIHHELDSDEAADIRAHLEACPECAEEHTVGLTLSAAVKAACKEAAPEDVKAAVFAKVRELQAKH